MNKKDNNKSIEDVEIIISRVLQTGVLTSAVVTFAGLALLLVTGQSGYPGNSFPTDLTVIFQGILSLKPYAIMLLGLFILILTPVLRVGISIIVFIKEKDYLYVKITALVFVILIISFILGKVE